MSRFSKVGTPTMTPTSRQRHSLPDLNRQLMEEGSNTQHCFFGPQSNLKGKPRVLHGPRSIAINSKKVWLESEPVSVNARGSKSVVSDPTKPFRFGISKKLTAASKFIGSAVVNMTIGGAASEVHDDSFCDGCGMDPIVGPMWTCVECQNVCLCDSCYKRGIHGFESSKLLTALREECAVTSMVEFCKRRVPEEVFKLLMTNVCKGQVDKFNFLANWIAGVVTGQSLSKLAVRGIEIPHLDEETRTTLVQLLTPVLAQRSDIEVSMEWYDPASKATETEERIEKSGESSPNDQEAHLLSLRIWIAGESGSTSPFESWDEPPNHSSGVTSSMASPMSPQSEDEMVNHPSGANDLDTPVENGENQQTLNSPHTTIEPLDSPLVSPEGIAPTTPILTPPAPTSPIKPTVEEDSPMTPEEDQVSA